MVTVAGKAGVRLFLQQSSVQPRVVAAVLGQLGTSCYMAKDYHEKYMTADTQLQGREYQGCYWRNLDSEVTQPTRSRNIINSDMVGMGSMPIIRALLRSVKDSILNTKLQLEHRHSSDFRLTDTSELTRASNQVTDYSNDLFQVRTDSMTRILSTTRSKTLRREAATTMPQEQLSRRSWA